MPHMIRVGNMLLNLDQVRDVWFSESEDSATVTYGTDAHGQQDDLVLDAAAAKDLAALFPRCRPLDPRADAEQFYKAHRSSLNPPTSPGALLTITGFKWGQSGELQVTMSDDSVLGFSVGLVTQQQIQRLQNLIGERFDRDRIESLLQSVP